MILFLILSQINGFLRYEFFFKPEMNFDIKKQAITFQTSLNYEDENFLIYGSFNTIFDALDTQKFYLRPIEGYFTYTGDFFEFTFGKKIYSFGKADWLNPTDIITPWDYSKLYSTLEEFREGVEGLNFSFFNYSSKITFYYFSYFRPNNYPIPAFSFFIPMGPDTTYFIFNPELKEKRENTLKEFEGGFDLNLLFLGFDMRFSFFKIYDRDPDLWRILKPENSPFPDSIIIYFKYNPIYLYGFDFSKIIKNYEFHGEFAYVETKDKEGNCPFVKNPYFYGIMGFSRNFMDEKLFVEIQGGYKYIFNYKEASEFGQDSLYKNLLEGISFQNRKDFYYLTFEIKLKLLNEKLNISLPLIYDISNKDYFSLSRISYDFGKGVDFSIGFLTSGGKGYSPFSEMAKHVGNLIFMEMKYSF